MFIAFGDGVALDTVAIIVSVISEVALAGDSVEGFISSTSSAGVENPVVSFIAVALSVEEVAIDAAVLVAAASSVDDSVSSIADTALSSLVPVGIKRASLGVFTLSFEEGHSVGTHAFSVDVSGAKRAERFAVSVEEFIARLAETSVRVGVIILAGVTVGANSSDPDILRLADTGVGGL